MPTYEQAISAGESINIPGGEVFYLLTANDPVDLIFYDKTNKPMDRWEGMKAGLNGFVFRDEQDRVKPFLHVNIYSATAQTVKVAVSTARAIYQRSQGDVTVLGGGLDWIGGIDQLDYIMRDGSWFYDAQAKREFMGGGHVAAVTAQYSYVELWNPQAGLLPYCRSIKVSVCYGLTNEFMIKLAYTGTSLGSGAAGINKYLGEVVAKCQVRYENNGNVFGTPIAYYDVRISDFNWPQPFELLSSPIAVPYGLGLIVVPSCANQALSAVFEWME